MGLSLKLFPVWNRDWRIEGCILATDCLKFNADYRVFGQLRDMSHMRDEAPDIPEAPSIPVHPLPANVIVETYTDKGLKRTRRDFYDEIVFAYARDLKRLTVGPYSDPRNYALKAYINALPDDVVVVLYWC